VKPDDKQPAWKETDALDRAFMCRLFLLGIGLMTTSEANVILERMRTWAAKHVSCQDKHPKANGT